MNVQTDQHPSPQSLAAFSAGQLDDASFEAVAEHLETCADCRGQLETQRPDSFMGKVRQAGVAAKLSITDEPFNVVDGPPAAPRPASSDDSPPLELLNHPKFAIVKQLGQGGMGTVYLADDRDLDRKVALKVMTPGMLERGNALERFRQEAKSAARLPPHPNVVQIYNLDHAGPLELIVMEHVPGIDLEKYVRDKGPLPVPMACHFLRQAALGLQHAFEHGLVHRDIKPNNLIVTQKARLKILDFGLARPARLPGKPGLTGDQAIMGTVEYMAPEQAVSARDVDIRADLYSLGCTAYYLLTGRPPFVDPEKNSVSVLLAHQSDQPPLLIDLRPDVPPELAAIVAKLLAKLPQDRYQKPVELAQALVPFIKQSPDSPPAARTMAAPRMAVPPSTGTVLTEDTSKPPAASPPELQPDRAFGGLTRRKAEGSKLPKNPKKWLLVAAGFLGLVLASIVIYVETDNGTVQITLSDPSAKVEVLVDGTISIADLDKTYKLKSGEHGLTVSGKEFETVTRTFTIKRGATEPVRIELKPRVAGRSAPPPPSESAADGARKNAYDAIAAGKWIPVLRTTAELKDAEGFVLDKGVLSSGAKNNVAHVKDHVASDMIMCARVKKGTGQNLNFKLREKGSDRGGDFYTAWFNGGNWFGVGRRLKDKYADLKQVRTPNSYNDYFDFAFSAVGNKLTLYADGKQILQCEDDNLKSGFAGISAFPGRSLFKDVEIMLLDKPTKLAPTGAGSGGPASSGTIAETGTPGGGDELPRLWPGEDLKAGRVKAPDLSKAIWPPDALKAGTITAPDVSKAKRISHDDFDDPKSGWPLTPLAGVTRGYKDGRFFVRRAVTGYTCTFGHWSMSEGACQAVGRVLGDPETLWGIELNNFERKRGVGVYLNGKGELRLHPTFTQFAGQFAEPHRDNIRHDAIKPGEQFNTILAVARGRRVEVYVNGVAVCEPLDVDFDFLPARLDLFTATAGKGEAEFESVTTWSASGLPTPEERVRKGELSVASAPFSWPAAALREGRVKAPDLKKAKELFKDEFTDPRSGWPVDPVAGGLRGYKDGRYVVRRADAGVVFIPGHWSMGDCACQAVGRVVGGPETLWGIELNNFERNRGVGIYLNGKGDVKLHPTFTQGVGKFPAPHRDDIHHVAIKPGEQFNTILAIARGRRVEVYVNGVAVCEPLDVDFDFLPARLDLLLVSKPKGDAEFERLTVYSADGLPSPEERRQQLDLPPAK